MDNQETNKPGLRQTQPGSRLAHAAKLSGDARDRAYASLDADLARDDAPLAAFAVDNVAEFFSQRLGCSVFQPVSGSSSLGALCLRPRPGN